MSSADLDIRIVKEKGQAPLIKLNGEIDIYTCSILKDAFIQLIDEGHYTIKIDMSGVTYVDSAGLGTIVGAHRRVSEHDGSIVIVNPHPQIRQVLRATRLDRLFKILEGEATASDREDGTTICQTRWSQPADSRHCPQEKQATDQADLNIQVAHEAGGLPVVKLEGNVDIYTYHRLKEILFRLIGGGDYSIIIEMKGVTYLDQAGIATLVGARRRVGEHDGSISIVNPNPSVYKILEITRLTKIFDISHDGKAALTAVGK